MSIKISRQCVSTSTWKTLIRRADILRLQLRKGALSQNERAKNNRFFFFCTEWKAKVLQQGIQLLY